MTRERPAGKEIGHQCYRCVHHTRITVFIYPFNRTLLYLFRWDSASYHLSAWTLQNRQPHNRTSNEYRSTVSAIRERFPSADLRYCNHYRYLPHSNRTISIPNDSIRKHFLNQFTPYCFPAPRINE